jgi:hypothetical protein
MMDASDFTGSKPLTVFTIQVVILTSEIRSEPAVIRRIVVIIFIIAAVGGLISISIFVTDFVIKG